jgi:hypothetical protein
MTSLFDDPIEPQRAVRLRMSARPWQTLLPLSPARTGDYKFMEKQLTTVRKSCQGIPKLRKALLFDGCIPLATGKMTCRRFCPVALAADPFLLDRRDVENFDVVGLFLLTESTHIGAGVSGGAPANVEIGGAALLALSR